MMLGFFLACFAHMPVAAVSTHTQTLLQARQWRAEKKYTQADALLRSLQGKHPVHLSARIERGLMYAEQGFYAEAFSVLKPFVLDAKHVLRHLVLPFAQASSVHDPFSLIQYMGFLEKHLPLDDKDARSLFLSYVARAFEGLGQTEQAKATYVQQYVEEPQSPYTPEKPPYTLSSAQWLLRAQKLQQHHLHEAVLEIPETLLEDALLTDEQKCQKYMLWGSSQRALKKYTKAMDCFDHAITYCIDEDNLRKAWYGKIKNAFMQASPDAVMYANDFLSRYPFHSMADDVLFWSGDFFQGKKNFSKAEYFFTKAKEQKGDYCEESFWRIAWMHILNHQWTQASSVLENIVSHTETCPHSYASQARAFFWLGKCKQMQKQDPLFYFQKTWQDYPYDYYGRRAFQILKELNQEVKTPKPPFEYKDIVYIRYEHCADAWKEDKEGCQKALVLYQEGLKEDAQAWVDAYDKETQEAHHEGWVRLASQVGLYQKVHQKAEELSSLPAYHPREKNLFLSMAFPAAYADVVQKVTSQNNLPWGLLPALIREESAFNPKAKSWAGAYGLTQLLPSTARVASVYAHEPFQWPEDLWQPQKSIVLGGATLGPLLKKYQGYTQIALAAYNAGPQAVARWLKIFEQTQDIDMFVESISYKETRQYVKRVSSSMQRYSLLYAPGSHVMGQK
jgi:soluble lytic murein transglycosylase